MSVVTRIGAMQVDGGGCARKPRTCVGSHPHLMSRSQPSMALLSSRFTALASIATAVSRGNMEALQRSLEALAVSVPGPGQAHIGKQVYCRDDGR